MLERQGYPDIHPDQVGMIVTEWGVMLLLSAFVPPASYEDMASAGQNDPDFVGELPAELRGIVRITHTHAKTMAILLKRLLKRYENESGEIIIPHTVVDKLGITAEEWE